MQLPMLACFCWCLMLYCRDPSPTRAIPAVAAGPCAQYAGEFTPCFYDSHKELLNLHLHMPIRVYFPLRGFWKSLEGKPSRTDGQVRSAALGPCSSNPRAAPSAVRTSKGAPASWA
jgi:hypothetical protein